MRFKRLNAETCRHMFWINGILKHFLKLVQHGTRRNRVNLEHPDTTLTFFLLLLNQTPWFSNFKRFTDTGSDLIHRWQCRTSISKD